VSVELCPGHIVAGEALAVIVGVVTTMMVIVLVPLQPAPVEPVAVYVVVTDGVTTTGVPLRFPGIQVYEVTPVAVRVTLLPEQIEGDEEESVKLAGGLTTTTAVAGVRFAQPKALLPNTE
jgi:hypothetical protein